MSNLRKCSFSQLFHLSVARVMTYELTLAVAYIHSRGFAHGDIHLRNVLVLPRNSIDKLSVAEFREKFGAPDIYPIKREDGRPLTPNVPATATVPLYMGKRAKTFTIQDARIQLSDFGEAFSPAEKVRLGRDCHTSADFRPPKAHFEPNAPLSFSSDVWSLATAIWDIVGMQALFSSALYTEAEVICQITDCLGPFPSDWYNNWNDRSRCFGDEGKPSKGRHVWPGIQGALSECVQDFRRKSDVGVFRSDEEKGFLDMMTQMLK
ncbi:hypothetical protein NLG97_g6827 [Lecanicillium saksenae]|uniref:Uncharacterized protein n=1 Tax=Lecanicillium saksenae TaxID=468837 RepID=A0ACC1QPT9_9HYPO|nr:hypothetical protein NLG97_g6827 [Lecanicillium saksenae]